MSEELKVVLNFNRETKAYHRYDAEDQDAAIKNVYVRKSALQDAPEAIEITVREATA